MSSVLRTIRLAKVRLQSVYCGRMASASSENIIRILQSVFHAGVNAVRAPTIFNSGSFRISHNAANTNVTISIKAIDGSAKTTVHSEIQFDSKKRCHLVGFGKGVFAMAVELSHVLDSRLTSGILSVPIGTRQQFADVELPSRICVFEGAENNLPDAQAEHSAQLIKAFVEKLNADDVLFVLITGGGSALLPLPCVGVSLSDKCAIIKHLAARSASINAINTVRTDLSSIKGGKLAMAAAGAHKVIALIVSDIINNPLHLIASGPTVVATHHASIAGGINDSQAILRQYDLWDALSPHIQVTISRNSERSMREQISVAPTNVENFIIASNDSAVNEAINKANSHGLLTVVISTEIDGTVTDLSEAYATLATAIISFRTQQSLLVDFRNQLEQCRNVLHFDDTFETNLLDAMRRSQCLASGICLIGGGEPTVRIIGSGLGGRNQELALRFSIKCHANDILHECVLLSAGTDGIDGPTTAAGAIGCALVIADHLNANKHKNAKHGTAEDFALNNDSFNFYRLLSDGKYHIITGHTGTNVMDLHILYIPPPNSYAHKL